ncbi:uncharacterized protein LOC5503135 isoform X1 [Nematostella vectensis]|uniref:uncharacterized protein LOC5503135 isoform X1 n=1 Tax=Nematostella vectensis TaxID=45351 RepID=UPI00207714C6|nr:uncharacterized protein LOC5503135 isoform X1 [Nematostella vectensis]
MDCFISGTNNLRKHIRESDIDTKMTSDLTIRDLLEHPQCVNDLAVCLDSVRHRSLSNWEHWAKELGIPFEIREKCASRNEHSATERLFQFLGTIRPELRIAELREILSKRNRTDVTNLLVDLSDDEKVAECITSKAFLLDTIASLLDSTDHAGPVFNWRGLATELGVRRDTCYLFETDSAENPTILLFEYLAATAPGHRMSILLGHLKQMERKDVIDKIGEEIFKENAHISEVLTPNSPNSLLLRDIADLLNKDIQGVANWRKLSSYFGVPVHALELRMSQCSPTRRMLSWLASSEPRLSVQKLIKTLKKIGRHDAVKILEEAQIKTPTQGGMVLDAYDIGEHHLEDNGLDETFDKPEDEPSEDEGAHYLSRQGSPSHAVPIPDDSRSKKPVEQGSSGDSSSDFSRLFSAGSYSQFWGIQEMTSEERSGNLLRKPRFLQSMEQEKQKLKGALLDGDCDVIVVFAPTGYGKTHLVVYVAHELEDDFRWAALYVNCRGIKSVEALAEAILEEMTKRACITNTPMQSVLLAVQKLRRNTVLVLENYDDFLHEEHARSAQETNAGKDLPCMTTLRNDKRIPVSALIEKLAQSRCAATFKLILTSRERLSFPFEVESIKVDGLTDDQIVKFLMTRKRDLDEPTATRLASFCDGIPAVAIVMLNFLKTERADLLESRLASCLPSEVIDEFTSNSQIPEERIDRILDLCFQRMTQALQEALIKVSVFPFRFTLQQALDVITHPDGTQSCSKKSLHDLESKYGFVSFDLRLELYYVKFLFRSFGMKKALEHKDFQLVYRASRIAFTNTKMSLLRDLEKQFFSRDSMSAIKQYFQEKPNLNQILNWCVFDCDLDDDEVREHVLDTLVDVVVLLMKVLRRNEFEALFSRIYHLSSRNKARAVTCVIFLGANIVLSCQCDEPALCARAYVRSSKCLEKANQSLDEVSDGARAQCLSKLGRCSVRCGDKHKGFQLINEALKIRHRYAKSSSMGDDDMGDDERRKREVMLAACYNDFAASEDYIGEHKNAIRIRTENVLPSYEFHLGHHPFTASTNCHNANSYLKLKKYDQAIECSYKALECREALLGDHHETARSLYNLGFAFLMKGDFKTAVLRLEQAKAMQQKVLDTSEEVKKTLERLVQAYRELDDQESADKNIEEIKSLQAATWQCDDPL